MWIVDKVDHNLQKSAEIKEAALWISEGEVVAFPTETVYGLGGNALEDDAIAKIFEAKGRPSDNPLIVHIATKQQVEELAADIPEMASKLMDAFWPGPLTLILRKQAAIAEKVTAGLDTVALRMPDHPVALALLEVAGVPVAAPSANLSGKPSPTTARHVDRDLHGKIAGIVDGGATGIGVESTVVDCTGDVAMVLRPGGITAEQIAEVVGEVSVDPALGESDLAPKSPGVKYTHYAPKGALYLVEGSREYVQTLVNEQKQEGTKVGVLTTVEGEHAYDADVVLACGSREQLASVASKLYETLRSFDDGGVDVIYSEVFPNEGVGVAIMNRLEKAAGGRMVSEK
ncbi:threonylcarbamoyl-AMP synthase [Desertibacillus haloalkaliphilus]|nr:L-threonylcarbamoyladenylate synthase [Desertibacillus haloalkaliphilus]MBU8905872.1 threonylcarbamoyl-AMP synthase [Desertibacillus haloalkaliphilus]